MMPYCVMVCCLKILKDSIGDSGKLLSKLTETTTQGSYIVNQANEKTVIVYSKICYNKIPKLIIQQPSNCILWEKDGEEDPNKTGPTIKFKILRSID